jgi:hypothetical protein
MREAANGLAKTSLTELYPGTSADFALYLNNSRKQEQISEMGPGW